MGSGMTCPGCDATSSTVTEGFRQSGRCPFCGLSASSAEEIQAVRRTRADEALQERVVELVKANEKAERRAMVAEYRLRAVTAALEELPPSW